MNISEFRKEAHSLVDWMADYLENVEKYPVKSQVKPGEILNSLPDSPPDYPEPFDKIFSDFEKTIMPGITHWQSPSFFAYFPANSSPPSLLGEMLTSTLGAQCMSWQTSPAAAELEERVMGWLRDMIGLPKEYTGVIQDTASIATLCSILTAREKITDYNINKTGLFKANKFAVYCSAETHSSIEKAVRITGLGSDNLRKISVDENYAMIPDELEKAIEDDIKNSITPLCVIATMGTTGSTAIDPLEKIGRICKNHKIWLHVDAAFAGSALVLPEMRWMSKGIEYADTFVFNPHKWLFTNFDCSAYFVKDEQALVRTFEILPEYLKTKEGDRVKNYRDWGIQLGRRFRVLKLWFVIRTYGVNGIREKIRKHLELGIWFKDCIEKSDSFELLAPVSLNVVCFRYHPPSINDETELNKINERLMDSINSTGNIYLTHTTLNGKFTLRMVIGQTFVDNHHVENAWQLIQDIVLLI